MSYWKLIFWGFIVLLVSAGIVWLYISVAMTLDQQPDSFDRDGFTPDSGGLGQVIWQVISE
ncbi:MAG: hypothetical protein MK108_07365 [Mariniblastus sp.]|nr:hypothetical protein [Mariniblastus sp.]